MLARFRRLSRCSIRRINNPPRCPLVRLLLLRSSEARHCCMPRRLDCCTRDCLSLRSLQAKADMRGSLDVLKARSMSALCPSLLTLNPISSPVLSCRASGPDLSPAAVPSAPADMLPAAGRAWSRPAQQHAGRAASGVHQPAAGARRAPAVQGTPSGGRLRAAGDQHPGPQQLWAAARQCLAGQLYILRWFVT